MICHMIRDEKGIMSKGGRLSDAYHGPMRFDDMRALEASHVKAMGPTPAHIKSIGALSSTDLASSSGKLNE